MKSVLLVSCALAYGFFPAVAEFRYAFVLLPLLLGLIYFALHQHDWPPRLVPYLFACVAIGRVAGYSWLNSRHSRVGPIADAEVWLFGGLAVFSFVFKLWRRFFE